MVTMNDVITEKNIPEIAESLGVSVLDLRMIYFGAQIRRSKTVTIQGQKFKVDVS